MTTLAKIGIGATFSLHNGTALTLLSEVIEIGLPADVVDTIEATHFGSPGGKREYIKGLIETGEGEVTMNWVAGSATDLLCHAQVGQVRPYKFVIPTSTGTFEIAGSALVTSYTPAVPMDDKMTAVLGLKFTGDFTRAAGA